MSIPVITPHKTEKHTYRVRTGLKFEFSGRLCEPEIILNSTRTKSGVTLGLGELVQLAGFVGLTGYEPYLNPRTVRRLSPVKYVMTYASAGWQRFPEGYSPTKFSQYYAHDERPGYTRIDIENYPTQPRPYEITVRNKWGSNPAGKAVLWPEDLQALIPFIVEHVAESDYAPQSEREYLPVLGVAITPAR